MAKTTQRNAEGFWTGLVIIAALMSGCAAGADEERRPLPATSMPSAADDPHTSAAEEPTGETGDTDDVAEVDDQEITTDGTTGPGPDAGSTTGATGMPPMTTTGTTAPSTTTSPPMTSPPMTGPSDGGGTDGGELGQQDDPCIDDFDCASGICHVVIGGGYCTEPCLDDLDCFVGYSCIESGTPGLKVCF